MNKKGSNFFEEHIEKIVLAIAVLVSLWFFITRVLFSPFYIEYDNDKFAPGAIDNHINKQVAALEERVNRKPEPKQPYKPREDDFLALFDSAIGNIDTRLVLPTPDMGLEDVSDGGMYRIPQVGEIKEILAEHIRAVAYVPNREIGEGTFYTADSSEPNDLDFVTVEAKFDVAGLYKSFNESFAGQNVQKDWRDPCLAKPVFAAVQLQRQELLASGSWSDWQTMPRSRVDYNRRIFKIIENVADLPPGGLRVRLLQFDNPAVKIDLLQPEAYHIASAKEEWFPPPLHGTYLEYQKGLDIMKRREVAASKKDERETERSDKRSRATRTETRSTGGLESESAALAAGLAGKKITVKKSTTTREVERERPQKAKEVSKTIDDIYQELDEISITADTDLARMNKPLSFWAFDDTVEPGKSYRYRIRLGVFNPIAGTNRFAEQDKALKNKAILWSEFSETTEAVDIPGTLYFFPLKIQETAGVVTVQVSKYVLGYWYSKDFMVKTGELIGRLSEYKITEDEEKKGVTVPKTVDYDTGAVLVDVVPVNDWSGASNLSARRFFEMLYSLDEKDIGRLPLETRYWPDALQSRFSEIKRLEKEPKEPFKGWGKERAAPGQRMRVSPTKPGEEEMTSDLMKKMLMRRD